jgi:hypothetical protein
MGIYQTKVSGIVIHLPYRYIAEIFDAIFLLSSTNTKFLSKIMNTVSIVVF